jgi:glucuronyl/N-acetylglucosaminyl transferase EXT2
MQRRAVGGGSPLPNKDHCCDYDGGGEHGPHLGGVTPNNSTIILSHTGRDEYRRRKRARHHRHNLSLSRTTVVVLVSLGATVFVSIHVYLVWVTTRSHYSSTQAKSSVTTTPFQLEPITLTPLRDIDLAQYTIRINTWKRLETLRVSLEHHSRCPAVAAIQVVWCTAQGPPPDWLLQQQRQQRNDDNTTTTSSRKNSTWFQNKVILEQHNDVNSLNERFRVLVEPTTYGVLSLDDDVLRPCVAYDAAFLKWTANPERLVGFDARSHEPKINAMASVANNNNNDSSAPPTTTTTKWKYAYKSTTEKSNRYSLTLTRSCFVHVDYLRLYTSSAYLQPLRDMVARSFECEDVLLSFLVSRLTNGAVPLLAPYWAASTLVKLDQGGAAISGTAHHKAVRDECVNRFAEHLHLKNKNVNENDKDEQYDKGASAVTVLEPAVLFHNSYFEFGAEAISIPAPTTEGLPAYLKQSVAKFEEWEEDPQLLKKDLADLHIQTAQASFRAGLIPGTDPWKRRFQSSL